MSTIMTEGKDHHKRKLMESASAKFHSGQTHLSRKQNAPLSAKLEVKSAPCQKKGTGAASSQPSEQAARLAAIRHTKTNQQSKQMKARHTYERGAPDS